MFSKIRPLFASALLSSLISSGISMAIPALVHAAPVAQTQQAPQDPSAAQDQQAGLQQANGKRFCHQWNRMGRFQHGQFGMMGGMFGGAAWLGMDADKHITENDARTIANAALIWYGERDLKVGKIETRQKNNFKFYIIELQNQQGQTVRRIAMNSRSGFVHAARDRDAANAAS